MKHSVMSFLAIVATLSSFISCQKEIETPKDDIKSSHTVSFVADAPRTKTNATIDGNKVNYSWVKGDEDKFNVYEIVNGRHTPASTVMAILKDGLMEISATFGGEKISDASYQAVFNTGVKTAQTNNDETGYDQDSDVLVSEVVSGPNNDFNNGIALKFKRLVAVNKATLKNLEKGAYVAHTIIETTDKKDLAGEYSNITDSFRDCKSKISVETLHGITGGTAPVNFITLPVADTKLKVTAVTIDDNEKFVAAYEKTFSKGISLTQGNLTSFGVLMSEKTGETIDLSKDETTTATADELSWDRALVHVMVLSDEKGTPANNYYPGTAGKDYTSTRFYKNSTLAITPMNSLSVSEIVFTATTNDYATALANSTWTNATASANGTTVSIIPTDGTKEVSAVISATTGHKSIEIIYGQPKIKEKHSVIISSDVKNGTITATPTTAYAGENITLTATPDGGYILSDWNVTTATGNITVTDNAFVMPDEDVTVSATFSFTKYDHAGTENDPYNVLDVLKLIETLGNGAKSSEINAKGVIKSITEVSTAYKNATYTIGDETTSETVTIYRGKYINGADFTSTDQIKIGDEVVIKGRVTNYNGSKQFSTGSRIVSLKRMETCATPEINIDEKGVTSITCATEGATIRYTVGDAPADPTETSDVFSSATLTDGQTIKAIAFAEGYKPSAVASKKYVAQGSLKTAILMTDDIKGLGGIKYNDAEKTILKEGLTWSFKANKDNDSRPWVQLRSDAGCYIKVKAPSSIKEIRITVTAASNSRGGIEDINKHNKYSGDIHLKTTDSKGNLDTNDVAKTSVITENIATLVPTGSNTELYIKVSAGARIWGIRVDY